MKSVLDLCLAALRRSGLLLKADSSLPSVTTIVAGEPVRGSWWAHPQSHAIFRTLQALADHPETVLVKLVAGKDTFVHKRLWPELCVIAASREGWQRTGLGAASRRLERAVNKAGALEAAGPAAKELLLRLLVYGEQFHTGSGSHSQRLESWKHWAARKNLDLPEITSAEARATFESLCPQAKFPWRHDPLK